ncbi:hypothetical protein A1O3_05338 [Capronia epimyces CBS 606.96]|uniref:Uncharacterized protein n=1 Tax=Capronia epimyces CBS 606.96 TaxID=1182542 RepID=W9XWQ6_9EURO|nr:uncharacterized protein A1O3_05338 [Capronia epimyces CBS 606.96]EXJ84668.1 hypothetical protein A1O3_05338 [Capronia epimyces CBS 606.96]
MAEQSAQDVVNQTRSVGDASPSDAPATTSTPDIKVLGDENSAVEAALKENGVHTLSTVKMEELDDTASARSDTDTSRADGSVSGDKVAESKPLKKLAAKPVSFAKYSVPKVIAASAAAKGSDKGNLRNRFPALPTDMSPAATPNSLASSLSQAGRPRLVAKTTSALQSQSKPYKTATPDPMQVWNKNRVTPQTSTKHLTDEELKQQYGIHLTSRIQADGDGKEAKWADIDDDEDDWAPETIEWNDGTKSTLTPAEVAAPQAMQQPLTPSETAEKPKPAAPPKILTPHFSSSVGPNATVLKLGASVERQQAHKTSNLQSKGSSEKPSLVSSKTALTPTPAKSPWAPLPPVDKVSPVAIHPQMSMPPPNRLPPGHLHTQGPPPVAAPSSAKEISADDFNRSWRDTQPGQTRELYMPNSGRYEAVPESRRRMSRNDQNFRAPAVLQRPNQADSHIPAEPSAAFQTHRTSTDQARRRASSTLSGGSGQYGRRMSIKSGEMAPPVFESHTHDEDTAIRPPSRDGPPTYQAHSTTESVSAGPLSANDPDFEVQRAQQKALMKEKIELARRRKVEEEQRLEAEKQERIRLKLASLGLDPNVARRKSEVTAQDTEEKKDGEQSVAPSASTTGAATTTTHSPPKPPQPLASGEPQQYGMMKVHPLDSVKKLGSSMPRPIEPQRVPARVKVESSSEEFRSEPSQVVSPVMNGVRAGPELRRTSGQESAGAAEPSPKLPKPSSVTSDARSGWGDVRHDHRPPQSGNLWGLPNNKSLGNGTFDQGLAGYAPQDLSRTSSTAQGWMNNRTPHGGRSPQPEYATHALPDSRSLPYHPVTSPDQGPLAADSEIDSLLPTTKPAPIAPPQPQPGHPAENSYQNNTRAHGVDAWSNFHQVASQQERAENERLQREMAARREEELRTGIRQGPQYVFNETWKQVQVGESADQRQVANISQSAVPASHAFGAVGSLPGGDIGPRAIAGPSGRGSRFFPHHAGGHPPLDRRAFTYSHPEPPRTPSPPPAEEYTLHPAFDGISAKPVVHFPREKAVVKLPPIMPPTPPSPARSPVAPEADTPMTWAARISMPPTASQPGLRTVSTPLGHNPSWQERFNGLLGKKASPARDMGQPVDAVLAVASSTREPLEPHHTFRSTASVSLPTHTALEVRVEDGFFATTKDVESEDDLFEDREPGSLPAIHFPQETPMLLPWAPSLATRPPPSAVEPSSCQPYMVSNLYERSGPPKAQYALIRLPGSTRNIKKDIPVKGVAGSNAGRQRFNSGAPHSSGSYGGKNSRNRGGVRSRHVSKAQAH